MKSFKVSIDLIVFFFFSLLIDFETLLPSKHESYSVTESQILSTKRVSLLIFNISFLR
jgi:hypothetical protein